MKGHKGVCAFSLLKRSNFAYPKEGKTIKNTRKSLLLSALALILCFSMLLGTTYAWFTDEVTSSGNIIKTGSLDVEMYWAAGEEDPAAATWNDASQGAIFNSDKWEPGYTEVRHIKIENKGTLALSYTLVIVANGEVSAPSDVIDVYYIDPAAQIGARDQLSDSNKLGTLTEVLANLAQSGTGALEAGKIETVTLALKMREDAGNDYQDKAIGSTFSVQLFATQYGFEKDSFGADYDASIAPVSSYEGLKAAAGTSGNHVLVDDIVADDKILFGDNTENSIDLNGKSVTGTGSYLFATQGAGCVMTIDGEGTVITDSGYAVLANKGSDLTVNGGTFNLGETKNKGHLYAQNSSVLTINGGTYISGDADTPIVYCINAFIEINGGFFQNTANPNAALISMSNNLKYANNQKITLSGGTFVNWNPMSSAFARPYENPTVPALIVLADGYQVVSEVQENGDTWYMVVPMN